MRVVLATHIEPVIHGQAAIAKQLAEVARDWEDVELSCINTAYVTKREQLGGGSLKKLLLLRKYARKIVAEIRNRKADLVILTPAFFKVPFLKDAWLVSYIKRKTRVKVIGWVHMDPFRLDEENLPNPLRNWGMKQYQKVDHWVACAPALCKAWPEWMPEPRTAISNGIPDPLTNRKPLAKNRSGNTYRITYLSAMDPEKGWRDLLSCAREICRDYADVEFHFYGGAAHNESEEGIRAAIKECDSDERIQWHGSVYGEDKWKALQATDLFVFPSHSEQFPLTILEAMAHDLPIISTKVGAVNDALEEESLVMPANQESLTAAIRQKLDNRLEPETHSNRAKYLAKFSQQAFSNHWQDFFKKQLQDR